MHEGGAAPESSRTYRRAVIFEFSDPRMQGTDIRYVEAAGRLAAQVAGRDHWWSLGIRFRPDGGRIVSILELIANGSSPPSAEESVIEGAVAEVHSWLVAEDLSDAELQGVTLGVESEDGTENSQRDILPEVRGLRESLTRFAELDPSDFLEPPR